MRSLFVLIVAVLMSMACEAPQEKPMEEFEQTTEQVLEELMALEDGAMERWRQGDPGGWAELAWSEISYFDPVHNHRIDGLQAYREFCDQWKGQVSYDRSVYTNQKVQLHGDVAVVTYNYTSGTLADDKTITLGAPWNTTEVYSRIEGQWRIVHTHWGYKDSTKPEDLKPDWPEPTAPEQTQGLLAELLGMENSAMERWRRGDPWGWIEISANEVTYFDPETDRRKDGIEQLRELYAAIEGQIHYDGSYFISPRVQEHGEVAILTYHYLSTGEGGADARTHWNTTEVYGRIDGRWKIIHTHWSYNMAKPRQPGS